MYKWLTIVFSGLLLLAAAGGYIYKKAMDPIKQARQEAEQRVNADKKLKQVDDFYLYNGSETYYVMIGEEKNGEKVVFWIPEKKDKKIIEKKLADGISKQEAIEKLVKEKQPKEILGVRLGMEKKLPVWELSYLDKKSNLNYYYIHFDTGKWWRNIENL
ncbi:DUF5590 domain-containing protein [Siminovitchia sp. 179-K 8D1 HS]|uniref:cell wall elongation regulator TseB-like domain-containing protein n=1 Tax=Siminovitchia sp. 179-K 8D1 HS TaxID=3142385 RepID=UPI00399F3619